MAGSPTALSKLGFGAADPVDTALNFSSFDLGVTRELGNYNGTRGDFFPDANRMIENRRVVTPRFSSDPTTPELAKLLEWVMGGTPTGTTTKTYPWSDTPAARNLHYKPKVGEEWFLSGVGVDQATFSAAVGQTHDDTRANFPALTYDTTLQPFVLSQLVLTVGGVVRQTQDFSFVVTGGIDRERFLNSLTLTALLRHNANFALSFNVPSGDNAASFWSSGIAGASCTAVFMNASTGAVLTFDFAKLKWAPVAPSFPPGSEGMIRINATAVKSAGGSPATVTLNPGA
jgi:hypothetical protein